jgi:AraC family transcriptional regulator of adaptative response/methylated-DNA-[protein]-cysteine methyltransferase
LVQRICRYIETNLDKSLTLAALGEAMAISPHHLQRTFKRMLGISPRQYADALRLDSFKCKLREGQAITAAIYDAGYGASSRLYERAPRKLGMTPAAYRLGGRGMRINYTLVTGEWGRLLVAATQRGICAVSLGDTQAQLEAALRREFPAAQIQFDDLGLGRWAGELVKHLHGQQPCLNLPLDVRATAFQWRVWEELRAIPYGTTRSYREIARAVGRPGAARAVARACAANPAAIVIPCHRVVRGDGSLGGYRWGLKRKKWLLEKEKDAGHAKSERVAKAAGQR